MICDVKMRKNNKSDHVQCPCLVNDSDLHDEFKMSKHGEMQWSLVSNPSWPGSVAGWNLPRSCWRNDPVMTSRREHGNFVPKREESFGRPSWPTKTTYYLNSWTACKCFFLISKSPTKNAWVITRATSQFPITDLPGQKNDPGRTLEWLRHD